MAEFDSFYLLSGYVPNSGDGLRRLVLYLKHLPLHYQSLLVSFYGPLTLILILVLQGYTMGSISEQLHESKIAFAHPFVFLFYFCNMLYICLLYIFIFLLFAFHFSCIQAEFCYSCRMYLKPCPKNDLRSKVFGSILQIIEMDLHIFDGLVLNDHMATMFYAQLSSSWMLLPILCSLEQPLML